MKWYKKLAILGMTGLAFATLPNNSQEKLEEKVENGERVELEEEKEDMTEANQWLRDFPEAKDIEGAGKVEKRKTPEAEYTLAHIKQRHPLFDGSEVSDYTQRVQDDIRDILLYLSDSDIANQIYAEGIDNHLSEKIEKLSKIRDKPTKLKELGEMYSVIGLGLDDKIEVLPAENFELNRAHKSKKGEDKEEAKMDPREDYLLEEIAIQDKPYAVTVYGKGHDFKDNIERWNEENPNNKFSYIGIETSSGIKKYNDENEE